MHHSPRHLAPLLLLLLPPIVALAPSVAPTHRAAPATRAASPAVLGRWDLTIRTPEGDRPSWLEVRHSGNTVVGQFVGVVGSARPIARVDTTGDSLRFSIPAQWEEGTGDLSVAGRIDGERLTGSITFPDGKRYEWTGTRAPELRRQGAPRWGAPIRLIRQNDLGGWRPVGGKGTNQWQASGGVLRSPQSGANLVTERTFRDFKLHLEFRYPKGSNSGVYLRGRHEVQIEDDERGTQASEQFAGVYGFIAPSENAAKEPGEWQSYDITLVGRMLTVVANGRTVICNQEIPGITGGAIDSNEGAPGPLLLQGDHGPIEYRNIVLTPAR